MDCVKPDYQASHRWLEQNKRLLLQHGPIDLIVQIDGAEQEKVLAFKQAIDFFDTVLETLVGELPHLRTPIEQLQDFHFTANVAQHMHRACKPFGDNFVTPMAAVAGSVADLTLAHICHKRSLSRVAVNNGGDIAIHLGKGEHFTVGICDDPVSGSSQARAQIDASSSVRGIASSGWQGRSHSLGIADLVTVLAGNASQADVAATLIANKIDLPESSKVERAPASSLSPDSDLGDRLVTTHVDTLTNTECQQALIKGKRYAQTLIAKRLIDSAILTLQGQNLVVGADSLLNWRHCA